MPVSSKQGKQWTIDWIKLNQSKIKSVVDLGCGAGKYPAIIKKKNKLLTDARWVGVEIWEPYIERFNLKSIYNSIIMEDIRKLNFEKIGKFNLGILGDVLEHMTKEESISVVNNVLENCDRVIISIPVVHFPQGESEGNPYEIHVKDDWSDLEVKNTFPYIINSYVQGKIGVYLLGKGEF